MTGTGSDDWSLGKSIGVECCDSTWATGDEADEHEYDHMQRALNALHTLERWLDEADRSQLNLRMIVIGCDSPGAKMIRRAVRGT